MLIIKKQLKYIHILINLMMIIRILKNMNHHMNTIFIDMKQTNKVIMTRKKY